MGRPRKKGDDEVSLGDEEEAPRKRKSAAGKPGKRAAADDHDFDSDEDEGLPPKRAKGVIKPGKRGADDDGDSKKKRNNAEKKGKDTSKGDGKKRKKDKKDKKKKKKKKKKSDDFDDDDLDDLDDILGQPRPGPGSDYDEDAYLFERPPGHVADFKTVPFVDGDLEYDANAPIKDFRDRLADWNWGVRLPKSFDYKSDDSDWYEVPDDRKLPSSWEVPGGRPNKFYADSDDLSTPEEYEEYDEELDRDDVVLRRVADAMQREQPYEALPGEVPESDSEDEKAYREEAARFAKEERERREREGIKSEPFIWPRQITRLEEWTTRGTRCTAHLFRVRPSVEICAGWAKQAVYFWEDDDMPQLHNMPKRMDTATVELRLHGLNEGHIILHDKEPQTIAQAALAAFHWRDEFRIGGDALLPEDAKPWIDRGASHILVRNFMYRNGKIDWDRLAAMREAAGGRGFVVIVLDFRRTTRDEEKWFLCCDNAMTTTDHFINEELILKLMEYCAEFILYCRDPDTNQECVDPEAVIWFNDHCPINCVWSSGCNDIEDLEVVRECGQGQVDAAIGPGLGCWGGDVHFDDLKAWMDTYKKYRQKELDSVVAKTEAEEKAEEKKQRRLEEEEFGVPFSDSSDDDDSSSDDDDSSDPSNTLSSSEDDDPPPKKRGRK